MRHSIVWMSDDSSRLAVSDIKPSPPVVTRYFVTSSPGGGWLVFREGEPRALHKVPRKIGAVETARTMARFTLPSEVIVEQEDGAFLLQYDLPLGAI